METKRIATGLRVAESSLSIGVSRESHESVSLEREKWTN